MLTVFDVSGNPILLVTRKLEKSRRQRILTNAKELIFLLRLGIETTMEITRFDPPLGHKLIGDDLTNCIDSVYRVGNMYHMVVGKSESSTFTHGMTIVIDDLDLDDLIWALIDLRTGTR